MSVRQGKRADGARWAVVGGGISGIAAAHYLRRQGISAEIIERDAVLGGRVGVRELRGKHVELGGKNVGHGYALFREFAASMGEHDYEHIGINSARVENGVFKTIDSSRRWRSLFLQLRRRSPRDLVRFARMAARIKLDEREGYLGGAAFRDAAERDGDPRVADYFTPSFCEDAVRPMSLLMNAAEPDEIFLGNVGTNVRMVLDDYDQLSRGMGPLLAAFGARTRIRLGTRAESLVVRGGRVVGLHLLDAHGRAEETLYDGVVLATTATAAAALLEPHAPVLARELGEVRYFPTAVVVAEYDRDVFTADVRALRFDDTTPLSNARAYGKQSLNVVRYTFSGRPARPLLEGALDPEALLDKAEAYLGAHLPVSRGARRAFVGPERAFVLCAYSRHHAARLERIAALARGLPGVRLTGDFRRGASFEACFRAARECVDAISNGERGEDRARCVA